MYDSVDLQFPVSRGEVNRENDSTQICLKLFFSKEKVKFLKINLTYSRPGSWIISDEFLGSY